MCDIWDSIHDGGFGGIGRIFHTAFRDVDRQTERGVFATSNTTTRIRMRMMHKEHRDLMPRSISYEQSSNDHLMFPLLDALSPWTHALLMQR